MDKEVCGEGGSYGQSQAEETADKEARGVSARLPQTQLQNSDR